MDLDMFGLEKQKKKSRIADEFVFELEKDLKDPKVHQQIKVKIEGRIQKLKGILREGEGKGEFDQFGALLQGYTSLLKVMSRLTGTK